MIKVRQAPDVVDPSRPAPARIYDYLLKGKHNFDSDRKAAERLVSRVPEVRDCAWANRGFHQRAAKWIAERGVRQFIDIGSGLPTVGNTHEVVQEVNADCRVAYVDNDPHVRLHAQELLTDPGKTRVILADLRDPGNVLSHPDVRALVDFGQPAGLLMIAVVHFVADEHDPWALIARYRDALPAGSYLSLSHLTHDQKPPEAVRTFRNVFDSATEQMHFRSKPDIERFFEGLELQPPYGGERPGWVCYAGDWGADDPAQADSDGSRWLYTGVAART